MSKGKIAPNVQKWMDGHTVTDAVLFGEIRALLAVARAAERLTHYLGSDHPGWQRGELSAPEEATMRALSRLKRASGTGRG